MNYILLIISFVLLVKGADIFVSGSASVAKKFNISDLIIGLTIVALGTSAPEIAVSTAASLQGQNGMAISNIIGSNIFNLLVVLGVCSIIKPIKVQKNLLIKEFPYGLLAAIVMLIMANDVFLGSNGENILSSGDGLLLLIFFAIFLYSIISYSLDSKNRKQIEEEVAEGSDEIKEISLGTSIIFILLGLVAVVLGGELVVRSASAIAKSFGVSETLIGLTVVSVGTSLPELVTSIIAAKKGNSDIAVGNVVGSNIFNILLTLGISSSISPILVGDVSRYDIIILVALTVIVYVMALSKRTISRLEGITMLCIFVSYNFYIFTR